MSLLMTASPLLPAGGGPSSSRKSPASTALAWLALLQEESVALRHHALQNLLQCVDWEWHVIAPALAELEALAEQVDDDNVVDDETNNNSATSATSSSSSALAAAVASKVFFYLGEPATALRLALLSVQKTTSTTTDSSGNTSSSSSLYEELFGSRPTPSPYAVALLRAALEAYTVARRQLHGDAAHGTTATTTATTLLPLAQLQPLVYRWLESACAAGQYTLAVGLCLEAHDVEHLPLVLGHAATATHTTTNTTIAAAAPPQTTQPMLLQYVVETVTTMACPNKPFVRTVLELVAAQWQLLFDPTTANQTASSSTSLSQRLAVSYDLVQTLQRLGDAPSVAKVIYTLLQWSQQQQPNDSAESTTAAGLTALQLVFDLVDTGDQAFAQRVADALTLLLPSAAPLLDTNNTTESVVAEDATSTDAAAAASTTSSAGDGNAAAAAADDDADDTDYYTNATMRVLTGGLASDLALSFLHKQSGADPLVMESLKKSLEERASGSSRSSVLHNAAVVTHAYLYAGTTNDAFLRLHLDWMKKASNWAKFTATASLGVIHAAHISEAMQLLEPYLPSDPVDGAGASSPTSSSYAEGGSLYALGLIHGSSAASNAVKRRETADYVRKHLRASHANEVLSHGACLAVGLTCMGSADLIVVHELKEVLDTDFAVAGEAAGMAIGMVLVGTGAGNVQNSLPNDDSREELMEVVAELKNYARETQHEKIIRGIAMGLALINFGQEENADVTIEEMRSDRDPIMRYGAQYATALAYCGTGSNKAIRILLHTAVSDVSDDVRMAAVIGLAFVLFKTPERVPQLVKLLLESFNPHVRYASCMAVGIAMAGSGDPESVALLEPMLEDMTDYVRQGALMGTAMIYMQQSDSANGRKIRSFREKLSSLVSEKHQSTLTKMGAALSMGLIDAGGRNCSLQLGSRNGFTKMTSAVGLALWLQHWHWYPMMHMLSLAFTPTLTIGLNKNFKYPKNFEIVCHSKPSQFAYPKKLQEKKEKEKKRVETVTLSTTAKEKARLVRKKAKMDEKESAMEVDEEKRQSVALGENDVKADDAMDVDKEEEEEAEAKPKKKRESEPTVFTIKNPARITLTQSQVCVFDLTQRYRPIRPNEKPFGVIMLTDSAPEEEEDLGIVQPPWLEPEGELAPPEPFEWTPPPFVPATGGFDDDEDDDIDEPADDSKAANE